MKKLESLFDLPPAEEAEPQTEEQEEIDYSDPAVMERALSAVKKVDESLPTVRDLDTADNELDEIADLAKESYKDLMDLGMNVESRFSGEIFSNAGKMLDTALSAKTAKVNKKLKMIDLQLKKATLDAKLEKERLTKVGATGEDGEVEGEGIVVDRNTLLSEILQKSKEMDANANKGDDE